MTRDICSLVEPSPLSPLQRGLESTTGYSTFSPKVRLCDQPLWVEKWGTLRVSRIDVTLHNLRRNCVVMLRRSDVEMLYPYDIAGRRIYDETATW